MLKISLAIYTHTLACILEIDNSALFVCCMFLKSPVLFVGPLSTACMTKRHSIKKIFTNILYNRWNSFYSNAKLMNSENWPFFLLRVKVHSIIGLHFYWRCIFSPMLYSVLRLWKDFHASSKYKPLSLKNYFFLTKSQKST